MTTSVPDFTPCQHYMCTFAKQLKSNLASYRKSPSPAKYECSWHRTIFTVWYHSLPLLLQRREFPASSDRIRTRQPQPPQQRWPRRLPPPGSWFVRILQGWKSDRKLAGYLGLLQDNGLVQWVSPREKRSTNRSWQTSISQFVEVFTDTFFS